MTVKSAEFKARRRHAGSVDAGRPPTSSCADTEKEKDDRIGAIGRAIVRCSATFTNDDGMDGRRDDDRVVFPSLSPPVPTAFGRYRASVAVGRLRWAFVASVAI